MQIRYTHYWNEKILLKPEALKECADYKMHYLHNGQLVKIVAIAEKEINWIDYFVSGEFLHADILQCNKNRNYTYISEVTMLNGYRHVKKFGYKENNELETVSNELYDKQANLIGKDFLTNLTSMTPDHAATRKYYYDKTIRENGYVFECLFKETGEPMPILVDVEELGLGEQDSIWIVNDTAGINELMRITAMTKELAVYYLSKEVLPVPFQLT